MSSKIKAAVLGLSAFLVLFTIAGSLGVRASSNEGAYRQMGVYSEVLSRIRSEYVEEPDLKQVTNGALHGLLESLDANSSYLTAEEYKALKDRPQGKAGIGATLSKRFGYAAIVSVVPGGPAAKAGLSDGDIIEGIEGRSTREMSLAQINSLVSGEVGSNLNMSVVRPRKAEPERMTVQRNTVRIPAVEQRQLESNIGYIKVSAFTEGKSGEVEKKARDLVKNGAKSLILDLRGASEGDMKEGVATADLFLSNGVITYLQGQRYSRETWNAEADNDISNVPLVVLVNRGTGGPAEVVAAAIMENARGDVLGDKTFGIGSIQKTIEIADGSALILSIAKYYTPSGKAIQDSAVTPNILVEDPDASFDFVDEEEVAPAPDAERPQRKDDEQLRRAIEVLKNRDAKA